MEQLFCLATMYHHILFIMEQLECIIMDGVTFVMMFTIIQLKLMSFVISWDTLDIQATLELVVSGVFVICGDSYYCFVVMVQTTFL